MSKLLFGLAALPFLAGVASAGQPLTDTQMDVVTAGFSATSLAMATSLGPVTTAASATMDAVQQLASHSLGELTLTPVQSNAQSASASTALPLPAATVLP